ncbi:hypothetical protein V8E54_013673 [Elaphomyces granulatus]
MAHGHGHSQKAQIDDWCSKLEVAFAENSKCQRAAVLNEAASPRGTVSCSIDLKSQYFFSFSFTFSVHSNPLGDRLFDLLVNLAALMQPYVPPYGKRTGVSSAPLIWSPQPERNIRVIRNADGRLPLGPKGQWASCQQRSEECVYTLTKGKTSRGFTKAQGCIQGVQWARCPRGGESMGICVVYGCQTAGELRSYEPHNRGHGKRKPLNRSDMEEVVFTDVWAGFPLFSPSITFRSSRSRKNDQYASHDPISDRVDSGGSFLAVTFARVIFESHFFW